MEDTNEERELHDKAVQAKDLLENYMLDEFFETEKEKCYRVFSEMPLDVSIKEYRTLHFYLKAMMELESSLNTHLIKYNYLLNKQKNPNENQDSINI